MCASFLSSNIFKVIGPGKATFQVHADLLAQKPKVLAKDVHGTMRENKARTIETEAVDDDFDDNTIMRCLEYAYTGGCYVPDPIVLQSSTVSTDAAKAPTLNELAEGSPFEEFPVSDHKP